MKIYLAGPIFTYGDLLRNTEWAKKIRDAIPGVDLYSPVENTDINGVEGKKKFAGSQEIANGDNIRLNQTDILVACIDGDVLPAGTCAEIGKFHEKIERGDHKYIVGICTDNRQMFLTHSEAKDKGGAAALGEQQYSYQNLYVTGLIKQGGILVSNIDEAIEFIKSKEYEFNTENPLTYCDPVILQKICLKTMAKGKPIIYCNQFFANKLIDSIFKYPTTNKIEEEKLVEEGYIGKFRGTPIYLIKDFPQKTPYAIIVPIFKG